MLRLKFGHTVIEVRSGFFLAVSFMLLLCDARTVMISLFSSLFHECGHILSMLVFSQRIDRLLFSASGLRIDRSRPLTTSLFSEFIIALSGVFMNFILCAFSYALYRCFGFEGAIRICAVNLVIAFFNLLPIDSLDGGRALMFFMCMRIPEDKAANILTVISAVTMFMLTAFFCLTVYMKKVNPSFAVVIIYLAIISINRILELKKSKI